VQAGVTTPALLTYRQPRYLASNRQTGGFASPPFDGFALTVRGELIGRRSAGQTVRISATVAKRRLPSAPARERADATRTQIRRLPCRRRRTLAEGGWALARSAVCGERERERLEERTDSTEIQSEVATALFVIRSQHARDGRRMAQSLRCPSGAQPQPWFCCAMGWCSTRGGIGYLVNGAGTQTRSARDGRRSGGRMGLVSSTYSPPCDWADTRCKLRR